MFYSFIVKDEIIEEFAGSDFKIFFVLFLFHERKKSRNFYGGKIFMTHR